MRMMTPPAAAAQCWRPAAWWATKPAAGGAGRARGPAIGRERGRCGAGRCDRADRGRADLERHRRRRLRHRMGWGEAARPQRLGSRPAGALGGYVACCGHSAFPERGWTSVSVPGAPDAWGMLHERFGRAPFESLFTAAIRYAEDGFPVSPVVSRLWRRAGPVFIGTGDPALDEWAKVFAPGGRTPAEGGDLAQRRARGGLAPDRVRRAADFYEGALAARIVECAKAAGGPLDGDDLAAFHGEWVVPISIAYRDHEVWEIPPNGQGIAALQALGDRGRHPHARSAARQRGKLALPDRGNEDRVRRCVPLRGGFRGSRTCRWAACSTPATSPRGAR